MAVAGDGATLHGVPHCSRIMCRAVCLRSRCPARRHWPHPVSRGGCLCSPPPTCFLCLVAGPRWRRRGVECAPFSGQASGEGAGQQRPRAVRGGVFVYCMHSWRHAPPVIRDAPSTTRAHAHARCARARQVTTPDQTRHQPPRKNGTAALQTRRCFVPCSRHTHPHT